MNSLTSTISSLAGFVAALAKPQHLAKTLAAVAVCVGSSASHGQIPLADQALFTANPVPGNLALALSVEFPTAVSVAHIGNYLNTNTYLGYFDPTKCYVYRSSATDSTTNPNLTAPDSYFEPNGLASATHTCSGQWSGNFLNWATMQTIDPFRWALTGGLRVIDTTSLTVLQKAWASGQGGTGNFPNRSISTAATIAGATPLTSLSTVNLRVQGLGNKLRFSSSSSRLSGTTPVHYASGSGTADTVYEVFVRAKVCDSSGGAGGVESNCVAYGSNHKPEGLIQRYANRIRYSAFGYLNDSNILRDGGVLRARQKFVGPTQPVPGASAVANAAREWDSATGIFAVNPDAADADATATLFGVPVGSSGVVNYLNKFGQFSGNYKTYDPVGELYYAAVRYFKNLGNVPAWTNIPGGTGIGSRTEWVDNSPVITNWDDPILYSCQRNFVLGIGDANSHADANVPGTGTPTGNEPTKPSFGDSLDAVVATNKVGQLEGLGANLGTVNPYGGCCSNNTALMAGVAYDSHTRDIRPDVNGQPNTLGMQTISTYWLDVMEYQVVKPNNQFLLAAKYGGFEVPSGFSPYTHTTALPQTWWSTTTDLLPNGARRPDNYFTAGAPDQMVAGLNAAFADIAARIRAYTTSFSTTLPQVTQTGNASFSTQYDSQTWTGQLTASSLDFNTATGDPTLLEKWRFTDVLATQLAATGWDTDRRVASWDPATRTGVRFRATGSGALATAQLNTLDTPYRAGDDRSDYLNYLRGDRSQEQDSVVSGSSRAYRTRAFLLGDIEGSKALPVGPPALPLTAEFGNPGYSEFKVRWRDRRTVVYVGANDGMLHAVNGALQQTAIDPLLETDANAGKELFAYVPSALFQGPNNTPATDGLAALGKPVMVHKYFVNATPMVFDIDFLRTPGAVIPTDPSLPNTDWRSVLVGGLGKGGKSYYAIDVTDPVGTAAAGEAEVARKVLWEFSDPDMGYTYGEPVIAKTAKYGWVYVFPSGYNNPDGRGYFFFVNPRTGELLEKISTGEGSPTAPAGLAHLNGYVVEYRDGTMDAVYAGDLLGNIWRLDVRATTGAYPAPVKIGVLTDPTGNTQPVTTKPLIEYYPPDERRFVLVGTGRLLDTTDITSTQIQSFYAITDGNTSRFNSAAELPTGITFPIRRTNLVQLTDPILGLATPLDFSTQMGWYIDLGLDSTTGNAFRVISRPSSFFGTVTFVANVLNADACSPAGTSRVYGLDIERARTILLSSATSTPVAYVETGSNVTDIKDLSVGGKHELIFGDDRGGLGQIKTAPAPGEPFKRLNWREIPTQN